MIPPAVRFMSLVCALAYIACVAGCFSPISKAIRAEVDRTVTFPQLRSNPEAFAGKVVLLGGVIVRVEHQETTTVLEILEKRLDPWSRPYDEDASGGRFLVLHPGFLDPLIYSEGRHVTVAAEVVGKETRRFGSIDYQYPVLKSRQLHLWPEYARPLYYPLPIWYYWDIPTLPLRSW